MGSLPSRERGLKHDARLDASRRFLVAPLAGAWIETMGFIADEDPRPVAPLAGAWIETVSWLLFTYACRGRSPRGSVD